MTSSTAIRTAVVESPTFPEDSPSFWFSMLIDCWMPDAHTRHGYTPCTWYCRFDIYKRKRETGFFGQRLVQVTLIRKPAHFPAQALCNSLPNSTSYPFSTRTHLILLQQLEDFGPDFTSDDPDSYRTLQQVSHSCSRSTFSRAPWRPPPPFFSLLAPTTVHHTS